MLLLSQTSVQNDHTIQHTAYSIQHLSSSIKKTLFLLTLLNLQTLSCKAWDKKRVINKKANKQKKNQTDLHVHVHIHV